MIKQTKKSQITIFIIIGISLLIIVGAAIFIKQQGSWIKPQPPEKDQVPTPIKEYVEKCIEATTREAVDIITLQGGYIYFPERIYNNVEAYMKLTPDGELRLPLWYFRGMDNSPTLTKMQSDLSAYIKENIGNCLENMSVFKDEYDIIEKGNLDLDVVVSDNDINIKLIYPLTFTLKQIGKTMEVDTFTKKVNLPLKKVYELSQNIFAQENKDKFFEKFTINLIAANEDLTPYTGFEISCGKKKWQYSKVIDNLKNMIEVNLPYIKLNNTDYNPIPDVLGGESTSYMQSHFYWAFLSKENKKYKVTFEYYKDYPFAMAVNPRNGAMLESNTMKGQNIMSYLCLNLWHFTYNVRYPIRVTVTDDSDTQNPISFSYAMEVSINQNSPDKSNFPFRTAEFEESFDNEEWCNSNQLSSINLMVEDEVLPTNYGLEDVNVSFICGPVECDMGVTSFDYDGVNALLVKRFPYCINGILRLSKPDYISKDVFLSTGKDDAITQTMIPTKDFKKINIIKYDEKNPTVGYDLNFDANESVFIRIQNDTFDSYSVVPNTTDVPLKMLAKKDYIYNLEIYLFKNEEALGGYTSLWSPSWEDLDNTDTLTFHVIYINTTDENEVTLFMSELGTQSLKVPTPEAK